MFIGKSDMMCQKLTFLEWLSSFFLILVGVSSSSSRLTLEATLESALMMFVFVSPFVGLGGVPSSIVELGVAAG
jgi:hypothetical protein